ncbi:hypothetical protein H5410_028662 [Solanum commersonii]|uniref:Uncharacterized protein n=1 Tax=Solanum commersonii TaxID=4109 RepID=A0A9J5Z3B1_SOLCO|nr:hypothetical protein H5410_028662 [Solanum commersonii]
MRIVPISQSMMDEEKILRKELGKWRDANTTYFFASMKGRKAQNQIHILTREDGTITRNEIEITMQVVGFY